MPKRCSPYEYSRILCRTAEDLGRQEDFGYPGDGINGVIGALQHDGGIDFIQARHEEMAAFEAVAFAKFTGELGCAWRPADPERPT